MKIKDKVFVAGHKGLVGSALMRELRLKGYEHILTRTHDELDLTDQSAVSAFFAQHQPDYVFLAAAKVGGIWANNSFPGDFIYSNLQIQTNVIECAKAHQVKRLLFLGSSCIYPRDCPQPMKESDLLSGALEPTNRPYAVAKIAGIEMCWAYNRQYGTQYLAVMPTNLYGPGDNYDLNTSHVIPALIRKMHEAKENNAKEAVVWGTGTPRREFLYSDDLAQACVFLMNLPDAQFNSLTHSPDTAPLINIGYGSDLSIAELAALIKEVVGFKGQIVFDVTKPDGTPKKLLSTEKINQLDWRAIHPLEVGLKLAYQQFTAREREVV